MNEKKYDLIVSENNQTKSLVAGYTDAKQLIEAVAEDMGLIPRRGDVMVYINRGQMKPYITKSGYSRMAVQRNISTKVEIIQTKANPPYFAMVKVTAVLPNGQSHEEFGQCDSSEPGKQNKPFTQILAMAITRGRNRALNIATSSDACSYEEFAENDEIAQRSIDITAIQNEVLKKCPKCGERGWSTIQKQCVECRITYEDILAEKEET